MATRPKPPTIVDVAREAGVSVATVSRVVNRNPNVTSQTRKRIEAVVSRLRYIPHTAARSLVTQRTHVIGVLLPDLYGEFFSELIRGIDAAARQHHLQLLVSSAHDDASEMAAAIRALHGRVEGLLVLAPQLDAAVLARLDRALPTVFINSRVDPASAPCIAIDSYGGARTMIRHLVACGHRSIAHVAGPVDNFDSHERERGYRDELASSLPDARPRVVRGDFTEDSGRAAAATLVATHRPSAVFAGNDMMAIGCLAGFEARGLAVPRDIAVAGFDDIPLAAYVRPALTTMRVPIFDLGHGAVEQLVDVVAAPTAPPPAPTSYEPELVIRDSCGCTRSAHPATRRDGGPDADPTPPPLRSRASRSGRRSASPGRRRR